MLNQLPWIINCLINYLGKRLGSRGRGSYGRFVLRRNISVDFEKKKEKKKEKTKFFNNKHASVTAINEFCHE